MAIRNFYPTRARLQRVRKSQKKLFAEALKMKVRRTKKQIKNDQQRHWHAANARQEEKVKNRIRIYVDDILVIDKQDNGHNPVHHRSLFGFRTYHTELWWDNLVITQL